MPGSQGIFVERDARILADEIFDPGHRGHSEGEMPPVGGCGAPACRITFLPAASAAWAILRQVVKPPTHSIIGLQDIHQIVP